MNQYAKKKSKILHLIGETLKIMGWIINDTISIRH